MAKGQWEQIMPTTVTDEYTEFRFVIGAVNHDERESSPFEVYEFEFEENNGFNFIGASGLTPVKADYQSDIYADSLH